MARVPNEKLIQAEKLFNSGMPMVEIAKKLGVSDGTVRSWKNRCGWGVSKKNKCNVAKKDNKKNAMLQKVDATLPKRKRGGQPGNQNSKGHSKGKGNPNPLPPPDATKHGGYKAVFMDTLDDEERELIGTIPEDEELLLMEQIQLFSIRERRIMLAINKYRNGNENATLIFTQRQEKKRTFENKNDEKEYKKRIAEKVAAGDRLPGNEYALFTQKENKDQIVARLEQELSMVQGKKTKAIEALTRLRLEKQKMNGGNGNEFIKEWVERVRSMRL